MADPLAHENWARYRYGLERGHNDYCARAALCEGFYLGGGEQWSAAAREELRRARRPAYEFNEIMPSVNSAIGYQIHNRMDISFKPRGGMADQDKADIRSKVSMHIADQNNLHWVETQVYSDGLIEQRGYFDIRMNFDKVVSGEAEVTSLDPRDVIPDADAKTYDPKGWADVLVTRWLTYDEVEGLYGKKARNTVEQSKPVEDDFGEDLNEVERNRFGNNLTGATFDAALSGGGIPRVRIIDRQKWVYTMGKVLIDQSTGDVTPIEDVDPEQVAKWSSQGKFVAKRMHRRVRWTVSTMDDLLHDDWSPYPWFTVVPYFCYFRRGKTRGMVDNAMDPQTAINKGISQGVHIVNSIANSGWMTEEDSIVNMEEDELEDKGAQTGLHIVYKKGSAKPEKIQPNSFPPGIDRIIEKSVETLKSVTVPDAMRGVQGPEVSGVAIQSKQFASQQQLAVPNDNLAYTRRLLANRISDLIGLFYTDERLFRITETDPATGKDIDQTVVINQLDEATGQYLNDVTVGTYDTVISEVPMQVTFENSQFQQALEMRKVGVAVPDTVMIRHSNLTDKQEILEQMQKSEQTNPLDEAKVNLANAQAKKTEMEAVNKSVEAQYSAIQTAQIIATIPQTAGLADSLLKSAGYQDQDAPPIVPEVEQLMDQPATLPDATNPLTPANPGVGLKTGIETPEADIQPVEAL